MKTLGWQPVAQFIDLPAETFKIPSILKYGRKSMQQNDLCHISHIFHMIVSRVKSFNSRPLELPSDLHRNTRALPPGATYCMVER